MGKTAIAVSIFLGMGGAASYGMTDGYFLQPRNEFTPESDGQTRRSHPYNKFTSEEDRRLWGLVRLYGTNNWKQISEEMPGRNPRRCKERWSNYLDPNVNRKDFTLGEDAILLEGYKELGPRWAMIRGFFLGRTAIQLKNRYHLLKKTEGQREIELRLLKRSEERIETAFQQHLANSLTDTRTEQAHQEAPEEGPSSHSPDEESQSSSEEAFQSPLFEGPSQFPLDEMTQFPSDETPQFPSEGAFQPLLFEGPSQFPLDEAFQPLLFEGPFQSSSDNDPYGGGDFDP